MKNLCLIIGLLSFVKFSSCQYSYVYEIRHNKPQLKSEMFDDVSQYRHSNPSELSNAPSHPGPQSERPYSESNGRHSEYQASVSPQQNTREFAVRSPGMGPSILNLIKQQMNEKSKGQSGEVWQSSPGDNSLEHLSNTNTPIYSPKPQPRLSAEPNQLPVYADKSHSNLNGYPLLEHSRRDPHFIREEQHNGYDRRQVHPNPVPPPPPHVQQLQKDERQTVHSIQTPNYRIQLVSEPESLDKLIPLLQSQPQEHQQLLQRQQQRQQQQLQQYQQQQQQPPHGLSYSSRPPSPYPPQEHSFQSHPQKPYILSVEPQSRRPEPLSHTISQVPEQSDRHLEDYSRHLPPQPVPQHYETPKQLSQPILELPKQQLPPNLNQLSRPIHQLSPQMQQFIPLSHRPQPQQYLPQPPQAQALYQIAAPNLEPRHQRLLSGPPQQAIPHVEYLDSNDERNGNRGPRLHLEGPESQPIYRYAIEESPEKGIALPIGLSEQFEKLQLDPSAQKHLFDSLKSKSIELSNRGKTDYRELQPQSPIATDPNYKSPPIPDEYKPFTQTRYYKTYV